MENCISPYGNASLAQYATQPLATEPDTPGSWKATLVGSSHPVWREMYQTLGWNFHSFTIAKTVAARRLLVLVTDHHQAALGHCEWGHKAIKVRLLITAGG